METVSKRPSLAGAKLYLNCLKKNDAKSNMCNRLACRETLKQKNLLVKYLSKWKNKSNLALFFSSNICIINLKRVSRYSTGSL